MIEESLLTTSAVTPMPFKLYNRELMTMAL